MYNLVALINKHCCLLSVFDKFNNELWNTLNYSDLLIKDFREQQFIINNVLFDDRSLFCVELLYSLNLFSESTKLINIEDIEKDEELIANEKMGIYGQARYIHRMFLKNKLAKINIQ